jgi:hypothetical protein
VTFVMLDALAARANPLGHANGTTPDTVPLAVTLVLVLAHVARASCRQNDRGRSTADVFS